MKLETLWISFSNSIIIDFFVHSTSCITINKEHDFLWLKTYLWYNILFLHVIEIPIQH